MRLSNQNQLAMSAIALCGLLACVDVAWNQDVAPKPTSQSGVIEALKDHNLLVGGWRGTGQIKRGSQQGAWQETAEAVWELKPKSTGIRLNFESGKHWKSALLGYDDPSKSYVMTVTLPEGGTREYRGKYEDKRLVLESVPPKPGDASKPTSNGGKTTSNDDSSKPEVHRMTLSFLNENRMIVLFEKRPEQQSFYSRVAEVAYQRAGTKLAAIGGGGPICVVTGGAGTMQVMHKGKTYFVCCTGCRDAFNDDPEGIIAKYEKDRAAANKGK